MSYSLSWKTFMITDLRVRCGCTGPEGKLPSHTSGSLLERSTVQWANPAGLSTGWGLSVVGLQSVQNSLSEFTLGWCDDHRLGQMHTLLGTLPVQQSGIKHDIKHISTWMIHAYRVWISTQVRHACAPMPPPCPMRAMSPCGLRPAVARLANCKTPDTKEGSS